MRNEKEQIESTLRKFLESGNSTILEVFSDYGCGKSHALRYICYLVNYEVLDVKFGRKALGVYISRPTKQGLFGIYQNTILNLKQYLENFSKRFEGYVLYKYARDAIETVTKDNKIDYESARELPSFFKEDFLRRKVEDIVSSLTLPTFPEYAKVFIKLSDPIARSVAWRWLSGVDKRVLSIHRELLGVDMVIKERIVDSFTALIRIFGCLNYNLLVCIDEIEYLTKNKEKTPELEELFEDLRQIFDLNELGFCLAYACSSDVMKVIQETVEPYRRRVPTQNIIVLDELKDKDSTKEFILGYLESAGLPSSVVEERVYELIHKKTDGNQREVLNNCSKLFDFVVRHNIKEAKKLDKISLGIAEKVLG